MRVIVYCREGLLASAIESLLAAETDAGDLIQVDFAKNKNELNKSLVTFKPNVIVTDDESVPDEKLEFYALVKRQTSLKILVVNTEQNLINLFTCKKIPITGSADFLQAIYS